MNTESTSSGAKYQLAPQSGLVRAQHLFEAAGSATTFTDKGGLIFTNVQLQLIFWGKPWGGDSTPSAQDIQVAVVSIIIGPYMWCQQLPRIFDNSGHPRSRRPGSVRLVSVPSAF